MRSIQKVSVACVIGFVLLSACGQAEDGFQPPKVGTEISWKYKSDDGVDDDVYSVVATGPDFSIFKSESDGFTLYSAEFSGIGFVSCDIYEDLPTRLERAALYTAWPPKPGTEFTFNGANIKVIEPEVSSLEVLDEEVFWFEEISSESGDEDAELTQGEFASSLKYGAVIENRWQDGKHDWTSAIAQPDVDTYEIQPGYEAVVGLDMTANGIGNCTKLLSEAKPITKAGSN